MPDGSTMVVSMTSLKVTVMAATLMAEVSAVGVVLSTNGAKVSETNSKVRRLDLCLNFHGGSIGIVAEGDRRQTRL